MHTAHAPLTPGTRLGKYEIVRRLRPGGMGELYLARIAGIHGFEKELALKRILPELASDPVFERMLLREAKLMATLHHSNVVQVFDVDCIDGVTFFVMEYIAGESLHGVLREAVRRGRGLTLGNALWIVSNVAAGLHYAHEKRHADGSPMGLIHRDVSPGNIMISREGSVKLVDFGVAKVVAHSVSTQAGTIKGSVRYMSPEQCLGQPLDRRSDTFSLGIVLFELTTGTRWIREKDDYLAVQRMLNEPLPLPGSRRVNYLPELEAIVMHALAKNPADRYPTAQDLQLALEALALEQKLPLSSVAMAATMRELFEPSVAPAVAAADKRAPARLGPTGTLIPELTAPTKRAQAGVNPAPPSSSPVAEPASASGFTPHETLRPPKSVLDRAGSPPGTSPQHALEPMPQVPFKSPLDETLPLGETLKSLRLSARALEPPGRRRARFVGSLVIALLAGALALTLLWLLA